MPTDFYFKTRQFNFGHHKFSLSRITEAFNGDL